GKIMEHHSVLLIRITPVVLLYHRAVFLFSKTKYRTNNIRIPLPKIANSNHAVEVHPPVSLNNLSHLWVTGDAREVYAPLLNNTLATDDG
ncbi:hypothetical protein A2U01_0063889, partial [Trifolium medium]|nr:hypothetical protein [Trifolium medium]